MDHVHFGSTRHAHNGVPVHLNANVLNIANLAFNDRYVS